MKRHNRLTAFLLAFCLLGLCLPPLAAQAAAGWASFRQEADGGVSLSLGGLDPAQVVYGVQLEATLDGVYTAEQVALSPADSAAYSPAGGRLVSQSGGKTVVELYLTSPYALNHGDALALGQLTANGFGIIPERLKAALFDSDDLQNGPPAGQDPVALRDVELRREGESGGASLGGGHSIRVEPCEHGTLRANPTAWKGQLVGLAVEPEPGYRLGALNVRTAGGTVHATDLGAGRWVFPMPDGDVVLEASFVPVGELPFDDVKAGDWFYPAVQFVYERNMMGGTGGRFFSPHTATSRGMIVTILHRQEGEPQAEPSGFPDVASDQWYTGAVHWAAANGVVNGYSDGRFGPSDVITREQMAAILYRYAKQKGCDLTASGSLEGFADAAQVSGYAAEAMAWAVGQGVITGKDGNRLDPKGSASRAEAATILMRFVEKLL